MSNHVIVRRKGLRPVALLVAATLVMLPAMASASETTSYSYDAKGRLIKVVHAGTVNNGVTATYSFDAADNRTSVMVDGAVPQVIVVPLNGFTVIPINPSS